MGLHFTCTAFFNKDGVASELKTVYETANKYHFLHTVALLAVPLCRKPLLVCCSRFKRH